MTLCAAVQSARPLLVPEETLVQDRTLLPDCSTGSSQLQTPSLKHLHFLSAALDAGHAQAHNSSPTGDATDTFVTALGAETSGSGL